MNKNFDASVDFTVVTSEEVIQLTTSLLTLARTVIDNCAMTSSNQPITSFKAAECFYDLWHVLIRNMAPFRLNKPQKFITWMYSKISNSDYRKEVLAVLSVKPFLLSKN